MPFRAVNNSLCVLAVRPKQVFRALLLASAESLPSFFCAPKYHFVEILHTHTRRNWLMRAALHIIWRQTITSVKQNDVRHARSSSVISRQPCCLTFHRVPIRHLLSDEARNSVGEPALR